MGYLTGIDPVLLLSQSRVQATTLQTPLVGDEGLEPPNVGIKIRCLASLANPQLKKKRGSKLPLNVLSKSMNQRFAIYIVISKPKRRSVAVGLVHMFFSFEIYMYCTCI
jgi:hypothetical protein